MKKIIALTAACALGACGSTAKKTDTVVPAISQTKDIFKEGIRRYKTDTVAKSVEHIVNADAQVVAFGGKEILFKELMLDVNFETTLHRFADEVLPHMKQKGYDHLVLSLLWSDTPKKELAFFNEGGAINFINTPVLARRIQSYPDQDGLAYVLKKAREHNVRVHPGGESTAEFDAYDRIRDIVENAPRKTEAALFVFKVAHYTYLESRSKATLATTNKMSGKVMIYNTLEANDCNARPIRVNEDTTFDVSFGDELFKKHTNKYLEVDLVNAELNEYMRRSIGTQSRQETLYTGLASTKSVLVYHERDTDVNSIDIVMNRKNSKE